MSDGTLTKTGARELTAYLRDHEAWFTQPPPGSERLSFTVREAPTPDECRDRAGMILLNFQDALLAGNLDETQTLDLVATTIQQLYRSQVLREGNTGTLVGLMANQLLLAAGLQPTLLNDPEKVMGCSRQEFVAMIKEGQTCFVT